MGYYVDILKDCSEVRAWLERKKNSQEREDDYLVVTKFSIDEIRFSWGRKPERFRAFLENSLEIAREKGRIIYDGQVRKEVTWENIDEVVAFFASAADDFV